MKFSVPLIASIALGAAAVSAFPANIREVMQDRSEEIAAVIRRAAETATEHDASELIRRSAQLDEYVKKATATKYDAFADYADKVKSGKIKIEAPTKTNGTYGRTLTALLNPANFKYNYKEQFVDLTSDKHKFVAPGPGDTRGPCPGLNLLANHGYFDHSGLTNLFQGIDGIHDVFGVEYDLALALNGYAVVFNGNPLDLTWSIGGPVHSKGLGSVTELLLGTPAGINAHNIYEGDASIVRRDYYQPGADHDNVNVYLPYFQDLLDLGGDSTPGKDIWTADLMLQHKANRWHQSVNENPLYFNSPFGGLVVTTAAERFVAEFAANNTADENGYNRIYLDEPNLLAFFGVEKDSKTGKLSYTPGHERLLPSWVRRPLGSTFGLDDIALTLLAAAAVDPNLISVGGNNGEVNTFSGVDAGDLTGGLFRSAEFLTDPAAFVCFLYQAGIESAVPNQLGLVYTVVGEVLSIVQSLLSAFSAPHKNLATVGGRNPCDNAGNHTSSVKAAYAKYPGSKVVLPSKN